MRPVGAIAGPRVTGAGAAAVRRAAGRSAAARRRAVAVTIAAALRGGTGARALPVSLFTAAAAAAAAGRCGCSGLLAEERVHHRIVGSWGGRWLLPPGPEVLFTTGCRHS